MTFIGKLFVMINLAISLCMAVLAFGVYSNGIDWSEKAAQGNRPPGKMVALKKDMDEAVAQLALAESTWRSARDEVFRREDRRLTDRVWLDAQLALLTTSMEPLNVVDTTAPPPANAPFALAAATDTVNQPLYTRQYYDQKLKEYQSENMKLRQEMNQFVKEIETLVRQLRGDLDTDPLPRRRGLRRQLVEERERRQGIIDEQGITQSMQVNMAVESELILKRLESIDERIKELGGYLKKKHKVDVPSSWR